MRNQRALKDNRHFFKPKLLLHPTHCPLSVRWTAEWPCPVKWRRIQARSLYWPPPNRNQKQTRHLGKRQLTKMSPPAREADAGTVGQAAVPAAEAAPEPDPSTDTPAVDSPVTAAGKAAAAMVAVLAAEPGPKVDPAPRKEAVAQDAPPARDVDTGADRQTAVSAAEAAPEPDPSHDTPEVESDATTPGKAGAKAGVVAVLAAKPGPTGEPPPRKETVAQDAPPARRRKYGRRSPKSSVYTRGCA